jgi:GNAT superfamily N-acetyltransferase
MALLFKQGAATQFNLQDFEPTFGEKFGAVIDETLLENPTYVGFKNLQLATDNGEKLSADEANSFLKQYPFRLDLNPKDGQYSQSQLRTLAERQRELRMVQDIRDRTPWDYGSPIRFIGMLGASMVDPINIASAFVPWTRTITAARSLEAARLSSSAGTRFFGRASLGAIDGGISTAVIEPFYFLGRTNLGDDYDALDSMANIAFGSVIGGGVLGIGGVGVDQFRRMARREIPSDRFAGMATDDIQLVLALDAELKAGPMTPTALRAVLESYTPEMRKAAGFPSDLPDIRARDPRSEASLVTRGDDGLSMTVSSKAGTVTAASDGTNLQITSATVFDSMQRKGHGTALLERTVNEGLDDGMSVSSDATVPTGLARAIEALERKGFVVTKNTDTVDLPSSDALPGGGVRSLDLTQPVYRIERGENYQRPEMTAQDQIDIMSPDTREATFRAGLAQALQGYGLSIDPIVKTDAAFGATTTAADVKKNADISLRPENIRAADFESSDNITVENRTSQGWDGLSDAETAAADADVLLDQTIAAGDQAYKYSRNQGGPDRPGVGVAAGNKLGFEPDLRVKVALGRLKLPEKPLILTGTTNQNAARQIDAIDNILAKFPNAGDSVAEWTRMMAYAFASNEVPIPPYAFIRDINSDIATTKLRKLTKGQIDDAAHGFEQAAELRAAYTNKELDSVTTGKLFMWSFLSRGVSPYTQEALFIDAFPGVDQWIRKAADGDFTETDFPAYDQWAKSVAPKGSGQPGAGATHNLNAFGKSFLFKMGAKDADGISHLQRLHNMMEDPNSTGKQIRREFMKFGEGVGIDNKVVSFTLLVAGFDDLMVLDRVQIRQLFDDGRFNGKNLYDGRKEDGKVVTGSSLADLTMGARGLLLYEAIERTLTQKIEGVYGALGRGQDASIGRYHWESWVADSQQEASHGTLGAILPDARGDDQAIGRVLAKQGEYGAYEYGAMYGRDATGEPYFVYNTPDGKQYEFNVAAFREFLTDIKRPATGVVPTKFKVTESGNAPWFTRPEVNQQKLSEIAAKWADRKGGTGEGARIVQAAIDGQDIPGGAGARYSRTATDDGISQLDRLPQEQLDELLQSEGIRINNADEADALYSNGYAIYAAHDLDETVFRVTDRSLFESYAPDQMLALSPQTIRSIPIDPIYARGSEPLGTAENAIEVLTSAFGRDTEALVSAGQLQMVNKVSDLPGGPHPADVKAMTAPDGRVYIVAENVSPAEMRGIVLHEVGVHVGMERMLGADLFQSVLKELDNAVMRGEGWAQAARDSVPTDTPRSLVREEQLAYLVQNAPELPLVQRIIAAVRAWAFRTFKTAQERMQLTEADFRALAISGLKFAARQQKQSAGEFGTVYARGATEDPSTAKSELAAADAKVERAKSYAGVLRAAADKLENDAQAVDAMRSQMPDITAQEIDELLVGLRTQVKNLRGMGRKSRDALMAGDEATALQTEAMQAADMVANNLQMAAVIERRNAALNLNARLKASTFINQFREKGLDFEGFAALLVGSERVRIGARMSIDAEYKGFRGEFVGGLLADMEKAGLNQAFISGRFDRDIYDALWRLGSDQPDMAGLSPEVVRMAEVINKYQTVARNRRNRFGAWIRDLQGYATRQTHDMFKIRAVTQAEWVSAVKDSLDLPKMIRLGLIDETDPIGSLKSLYNDFASGSHMKPMAAEEDIVALGRGSNLAKRESVSRTLYFKDGLAAYDYHAKFGVGRLAESIIIGLDRSASSAAQLKTLGTNPMATLTRLLDEYEESLKTTPDRFDKFRSQRGAIMNLLAQVDGSVNIPGSVQAAKINSFIRSWTSMAKLGGALISSISDLTGYAAELRYAQNKNMLSGMVDGIGALTKGRAKGERAEILSSLGVFYESVSGAVSARFDNPELVAGKMAATMRTFFRLNGLTWWTEVLRDGTALSHSHYMAQQGSKKFGDIDPELRRLFTLYNIDEGKWDLLRMGQMKTADGRAYLTPDALNTVPQEAFENYIRSIGRTVSPASVQNLIDDLGQTMRTMFLDRAHHAVLEPNARNRAFMLRGTKPGTVPGEILRYISQFKSFSVAITQSVLGREVYGRGYDTFGEYLRKGQGDWLGMAYMISLYGLLGYGAMSVKDLIKGREPRNPLNPQTVIASLAQGGGLGLYGDFLFGEYSRFGKSLVSSIAGPVAGAADTIAELYTRARNGDDLAGTAFKAILDNTPFNNLFWLRPLLDYTILFNIQESMNPGFLRRMERRVERQNDQRFLFKPSEVIR